MFEKIHLNKGIRLFKKGKYEEADYEFIDPCYASDKALQISGYRYRADSNLHLGNLSKAAEMLKTCISLCDNNSEYNWLDDLCLRLVYSCIKENRNDALNKAVDSALSLNIPVYRYLTNSYLELGNLSKATEMLEKYISLCDINNEDVYYSNLDELCLWLVNRCIEKNCLSGDVIRCLKNTRDKYSNSEAKSMYLAHKLGETYSYLAKYHLDTGKDDLAISDLTLAIESFDTSRYSTSRPAKSSAYRSRGYIYYYKKEYGKAIIDFLKTIELEPEECKNYKITGHAYYLNGDYINAIANYNKASELDKNESLPNLKDDLKDACEQLEKTNPKFSQWAEYIKKNPNEAKGYIELGIEYANAGLHDQAFENSIKAGEFEPDNVMGYLLRGYSFMFKGDYDKKYYNDAIANLKHALELDPNLAQAHAALADTYSRFSETLTPSAAREKLVLSLLHYERALTIDPTVFAKESDVLIENVIKKMSNTVGYEINSKIRSEIISYHDRIVKVEEKVRTNYDNILRLHNDHNSLVDHVNRSHQAIGSQIDALFRRRN